MRGFSARRDTEINPCQKWRYVSLRAERGNLLATIVELAKCATIHVFTAHAAPRMRLAFSGRESQVPTGSLLMRQTRSRRPLEVRRKRITPSLNSRRRSEGRVVVAAGQSPRIKQPSFSNLTLLNSRNSDQRMNHA